ncbi:hypothetical protein ACQ0QQ_02740 [Lysinibacillus sphaericus]
MYNYFPEIRTLIAAFDFRAGLRFPRVTREPPRLRLREEKRRGFEERRVAYDESATKAFFAFLDELAYDMCL